VGPPLSCGLWIDRRTVRLTMNSWNASLKGRADPAEQPAAVFVSVKATRIGLAVQPVVPNVLVRHDDIVFECQFGLRAGYPQDTYAKPQLRQHIDECVFRARLWTVIRMRTSDGDPFAYSVTNRSSACVRRRRCQSARLRLRLPRRLFSSTSVAYGNGWGYL